MSKFVNRFSGFAIGSAAFVGISGLLPAIASAPLPPQLFPAVLGGKTVYVLNMTRAGDRVMVRCYPGQQPKLTVQTKPNGTKEGSMVCGN